MKKKPILLLVSWAVLLLGCESPASRRADLEAEEKLKDAKETLQLGAMAYNLRQCYEHLKVTEDTADRSPRWREFKKSHHIVSTPRGMSEEDLKDCQTL
jgi:hypothetical protein